jgi:hypothetical protein
LCGEKHAVRFHGYPLRCVRDREQRRNDTIAVVVIRCENARAANRPYTMRILPDFLIPGCVIRLDHVEEAAEAKRAGTGNDRLCEILGCLDDRTARRHLRRYGESIDEVALLLAETRSKRPELGELPKLTPDTSPQDRLVRLWQAEQIAMQRRGEPLAPTSLRQLLQTAMRKSGRKSPSSCVSGEPRPP